MAVMVDTDDLWYANYGKTITISLYPWEKYKEKKMFKYLVWNECENYPRFCTSQKEVLENIEERMSDGEDFSQIEVYAIKPLELSMDIKLK